MLETACRAMIDYKAILQQIPAEERALTPPPSVFQARIRPFQQSPVILKPRKPWTRNSCSSTDITVHDDLQSPSSSSDESPDIETPSKPRTRSAQSRLKQSYTTNTSQAAGSDVHYRHYCTQACLLGLVRRRLLDEACPNVSVYRSFGAGSHYALDQKTLARHILHQLTKDPDVYKLLGRQKQGACSTLFKLTLES